MDCMHWPWHHHFASVKYTERIATDTWLQYRCRFYLNSRNHVEVFIQILLVYHRTIKTENLIFKAQGNFLNKPGKYYFHNTVMFTCPFQVYSSLEILLKLPGIYCNSKKISCQNLIKNQKYRPLIKVSYTYEISIGPKFDRKLSFLYNRKKILHYNFTFDTINMKRMMKPKSKKSILFEIKN